MKLTRYNVGFEGQGMSRRWWPQFGPRWFSRVPAGLAQSPMGIWLSPWALNEGTAFCWPGCPGQWPGTTACCVLAWFCVLSGRHVSG
eukprot:5815033-Prymnesium_polylepis.1